VVPNGSIGFRWGEKGKWNLEPQAAGHDTELTLSLLITHDSVADVAFPTLAATRTRISAA
jgi:nitrate reductase alpha subunit